MRAAPPFPGTMWAASIYKTHLEPASPFQLHQLPCLSPKPLQHLLSSGPQTAPLRGTPLGCAGLCVTWSHRSPGTLQPRLTLHQLSVSRPNSSFPQSLCRAVPLAWNALLLPSLPNLCSSCRAQLRQNSLLAYFTNPHLLLDKVSDLSLMIWAPLCYSLFFHSL